MHRHLSTGSATIAALMAAQQPDRPDATPPGVPVDIARLLASMGDHGFNAGPRENASPRPG